MAASRRRKHSHAHEEEHINHERWLVTYADMLTLLMVLFIVLFAISNVDKKKFAQLHKGLSKAFNTGEPATAAGSGILDGGKTVSQSQGGLSGTPTGPEIDTPTVVQATSSGQSVPVDASLGKVQQEIAKALTTHGLSQSVAFSRDARGLIITIVTDRVLFDIGSADLRPEGTRILDVIAPALRTTPHDIDVEGHTDDVPISGQYADNWALSTARSTTVLRRMLADHVPADHLAASGYAATHPVVPNDSDAHRSRNRRVEVVVLAGGLSSPGPLGGANGIGSKPAVVPAVGPALTGAAAKETP